jgi:hypothetical protein
MLHPELRISTPYREWNFTVSLDYYDRAPFPFNGHINNVNVRYSQ